MTMPYTSVFFQLDCNYCTDEDEQKIRQAMKSSPPKTLLHLRLELSAPSTIPPEPR